MVKRKIVKKNLPPDVSAVKLFMLSSVENESFSKMTDEELEKEKQRLINVLQEEDEEEKE